MKGLFFLLRTFHCPERIACTHLSVNDIDLSGNKHPLHGPVGAGMVIRSQLLKDLSTEGWLKLVGRKGSLLSSGEDTEISLYVKKRGYRYGYNPKMLMEHIIPAYRLTEEYAYNLINAQEK